MYYNVRYFSNTVIKSTRSSIIFIYKFIAQYYHHVTRAPLVYESPFGLQEPLWFTRALWFIRVPWLLSPRFGLRLGDRYCVLEWRICGKDLLLERFKRQGCQYRRNNGPRFRNSKGTENRSIQNVISLF